jgi:hypothetical protein
MPLEDQTIEEGQLAKNLVLMHDLESGGGHRYMMDERLDHSAAWGATRVNPRFTPSFAHAATATAPICLGCGRRLL